MVVIRVGACDGVYVCHQGGVMGFSGRTSSFMLVFVRGTEAGWDEGVHGMWQFNVAEKCPNSASLNLPEELIAEKHKTIYKQHTKFPSSILLTGIVLFDHILSSMQHK